MELHDRLTRRYPCICTLSDDRVDDDGLWSDGPLWNDFGRRFLAAVPGKKNLAVPHVFVFTLLVIRLEWFPSFGWLLRLN